MKLKLDAEGKPEIQDGHPVFIGDDGTESAVNVAQLQAKVAEANREAADRRIKLKDAEARLQLFGDLDPAAAKKAIAFREQIGKDLDPEKVSVQLAELKSEKAGLVAQLEERDAKIAKADETIDSLSIGSKIAGSEFIRGKVVPALQDPDLFRSAYGKHIARDESGNAVFKDAAGNTIMSEKNPGQPADIDEALPRIVTNPHHLAAGNANGPGDKHRNNGNDKPLTTQKRNEMDATAKGAALRQHMEAGGTLESFMGAG